MTSRLSPFSPAPPPLSRRPLRVLIVEDEEADAELLLLELRRSSYDVEFERVDSQPAMRKALVDATWDVVLADYSLPGFSALGAIETLRGTGLDIPLIVISGTISEDMATESLRAGARDFVLKDRLARLRPAIDRELEEAKSRATLRRTEEQLRQSQKMEAIGQLAGGIAHDFNNALSVILLNAELLEDGFRDGTPSLADVEEITQAALRATELTKQLLAFGRQQLLATRVVDLNDIVTSMERMLRRVLGASVDVVTVLGHALGKVDVDPSQIEHVLMNLAVNARDAMPRGGKVRIITSNVDLDERAAQQAGNLKPGGYVLLAVGDDGTGMNDETRARIFEPFFTTKERGRGTGLGLAMVFGIVSQSGGAIVVDSELGKGAEFRIYLPRTDRETSKRVPSTTPRQKLNGSETILVAEDDSQIRTRLGMVLRRAGYRVLEARSGGDALLICEQHQEPIHLLLTDVQMPRMSGREVVARLRLVRPEMKAIQMSAYSRASATKEDLIDPDVVHLPKPVTADKILRKVREVLDQGDSGVRSSGG